MKGVQCSELFGGIALKNHAFSFSLLILGMLHTLSEHMVSCIAKFPERCSFPLFVKLFTPYVNLFCQLEHQN